MPEGRLQRSASMSPSVATWAPNLDGAPTGSTYFPKFFTMATSGDHAYVNARFDGMWIFQFQA